MFRVSFILLVVVGVLFSITAARPDECPENQEWNSCGSACPQSCNSNPQICTMQCVPRCQCKKGLLLDAKGNCVSREEC